MMRLGIVGNRKFKDLSIAYQAIHNFISDYLDWDIDMIISGGAIGIDLLAKDFAKEFKISFKEYSPKELTKVEFFARNKQIADNSDFLLCFINQGQYRSGTWNTIDHFTKISIRKHSKFMIYNEHGEKWYLDEYPRWLKERLKKNG